MEIQCQGSTPLEQMSYAAAYAAGYLNVPSENIAIDLKRARLVIYDRAHDEDGAEVTRILRPSRTNRGLWFEITDDGRAKALLDILQVAD